MCFQLIDVVVDFNLHLSFENLNNKILPKLNGSVRFGSVSYVKKIINSIIKKSIDSWFGSIVLELKPNEIMYTPR